VSFVGTSRGAYVGLRALERAPRLFRAAALAMGFYDLAAYIRHERSVRPSTSPLLWLSGERGEWPEVLKRFGGADRSALRHLADVSAPVLLVHGDADRVVPVSHSVELAQQAASSGGPVISLEVVPGMGHDILHSHPAWPRLWSRIAAFFKEAP
jgi:dipeptidyl aminopeptidase/acylaminoacyl peptidase